MAYQLVRNPGEVLVVGAGTGNDVAAALRHGATHVDAVEIDPVILHLGREYHPECPYDSPRVTVHVDDGRPSSRNQTRYDLIVFGYLDSHTMLTSFSSIRLDNYDYTLDFLLLETKAVTELALLFGSTWVVNAVVIGAVLTMALLANAFIMYRPVSRRSAYIGLFVFLAVSALFPYAILEALPTPAKVAAAGIIAALPVFFTGLVFSRSFRDVSKPAPALGVNLLGAVIGGVSENTVMVAGTPILRVLAIASLSAIAMSPMSTPRK
jgi:hypothetical protein